MNQTLILLILLLPMALSLTGQSSLPDQEVLAAREQSVQLHRSESNVANILTGRRYTEGINQFKQYFLGKYTTYGTLVFDGVLFDNIELQYNLYTQKVIALLETESVERYVIVTPDKVSRFSIYGHDFVQYPGDSVMAPGIYQLAHQGEDSKVFIKRTSIKKETIRGGEVNVEYKPINKYYITNPFGSFHITGKKKLIQAYRGSATLNSIIKKHKIKFSKKQIELGLVTAITQYESFTKLSNQ